MPGDPDLSHIVPELRSLAIPLEGLTLDPDNARKHSQKDLDATRESMIAHGVRQSITVQKRGDELVIRAGNGRVMIARKLGWTHLPAVVVEEDDDAAVKYAIRHNRTGELAEWDVDVLRSLGTMHEIEWSSVGFDAGEISDMLTAEAPQPEKKDRSTKKEQEKVGESPEPEPPMARGEKRVIGPHVLHCDDCMTVLASLPENSIDSVVTDPPYGLAPDGRAYTWDDLERLRSEGKGPKKGFMGREWDAGVPGPRWAAALFRVMKPGAHAVIFSATRTIHRLTCALEDSGFEVRDMLGWLQWQGMPKSLDLSKEMDRIDGHERTLRPGPYASLRPHAPPDNSRVYGAGTGSPESAMVSDPVGENAKRFRGVGTGLKPALEPAVIVRKPPEGGVAKNALQWGTGGLQIDESRIPFDDPAWPGPAGMWTDSRAEGPASEGAVPWGSGTKTAHEKGRWPPNIYATPKASRSEREAGCEGLAPRSREDVTGRQPDSAGANHGRAGITASGDIRNDHPTVKPRTLISWCVGLVTPPEGVVLDPFAGSGTIFAAATDAGRSAIGVEMDPHHCDICVARAVYAQND